jgi:uncharacterized membrane protein YoaK (UPF0700 family)
VLPQHRGRLLAVDIYLQIALVAAATAVAWAAPTTGNDAVRYLLIVLLAVKMGLQNAVVRRLGVPDLTTTVLTLTLTGIAADSKLAGGSSPNTARRLAAAVTMLIGAALGALLVFHAGVGAALGAACVLLAGCGVLAYRASSSSASWTAGASK